MAVGDATTGGSFTAADMYLAMYPDIMRFAQDVAIGRGVAPGTQAYRDAMRNVAAQHRNDNAATEPGRVWPKPAVGYLDATPDSAVAPGPTEATLAPGQTVDVGRSTWTAGPEVPFQPGTYDIGISTTYNTGGNPYQNCQDAINAGEVDEFGNPKAPATGGTTGGTTLTSAPKPGTTSAGAMKNTAAMLSGMVGGNSPGPRGPFGGASRLVG